MILSAGYNFKEDPLATALILQTLSSLTTKKLRESFEGLRNKTGKKPQLLCHFPLQACTLGGYQILAIPLTAALQKC
jgi:hypothetical protein